MPEAIYIISDMEFDVCMEKADKSVFDNAKGRFEAAGYRLPKVVFWNVASRHRQQPVTRNEAGAALVSGCTPRLFSMALSDDLTPFKFMMEVLESERYAPISA